MRKHIKCIFFCLPTFRTNSFFVCQDSSLWKLLSYFLFLSPTLERRRMKPLSFVEKQRLLYSSTKEGALTKVKKHMHNLLPPLSSTFSCPQNNVSSAKQACRTMMITLKYLPRESRHGTRYVCLSSFCHKTKELYVRCRAMNENPWPSNRMPSVFPTMFAPPLPRDGSFAIVTKLN